MRKAFKVTNANQGTAGSDDTVVILYRIEAQDLANSGWNYTSSSSYITLSYWVKSSVQQNFYVTIKSGDGTTQKYPTETGSLSANTWTKVTKTIPGNSNITFNNDNGEGLEIEWSLYRGTDQTGSMSLNAWAANNNSVRTPDQPVAWFQTNGATFELTGVQLEVGSTATAFEHRSFAEELERCKRYFFILGKDVNRNRTQLSIPFINEHPSNRSGYINLRFNPEMRATPSVTIGSELELGKPQVDMSSHKVSNFGNPHATGVYYFQYTNQTGNTGDANMYMRIGQDDNSYAEFSAEL